MLGEDFTKRCLVEPGKRISLNDFPTDNLGILDQPESEATPLFHELRSKLSSQQRVLYAVRVTPFKAPSTRELAHDFLWRVHQVVPAKGEIAVFNRSHYEDIIAVRVKNLAPKEVWEKRYQHIINFEQMLVDEGTTILKIFLHISKEEQRKRLQSRLDRPEKHWKFFPEDLADRARWDDFEVAYEDVFERTSTKDAPWFIVPADHKWYRDMAVSQIVTHAMDKMGLEYPKVTWDPSKIVGESGLTRPAV